MITIPSYSWALLHRGSSPERNSYYYLHRDDIPLETRQLMAAMDLLPLKKANHFKLLNAMAVQGNHNPTLNKVREIVAAPISAVDSLITGHQRPENRLRGAWARHALEQLKLKPNTALVGDSYDLNSVYMAPNHNRYVEIERYQADLHRMDLIMQFHGDKCISYGEGGRATLPGGITPFLAEFYWYASAKKTHHAMAVQRGITILGKRHPLGEAAIERAATELASSPQAVNAIVEAGLSVDRDRVYRFLDLVSEYNVEWAIASYDWSSDNNGRGKP